MTTTMIRVALIDPDPLNVRDNTYDGAELNDLAEDIRKHGMHNAITVYPRPDNPERYKIWFGHRRTHAVRMLGVHEIEAHIVPAPASELERIVRQISENEKRKDLNPMELARSYRAALDSDAALNQTLLAKRLGVATSKVSEHLMLLEMPPDWQEKAATHQVGVQRLVKKWTMEARAPVDPKVRKDAGGRHNASAITDDVCLNSDNPNYPAAWHMCNQMKKHPKSAQTGGACGDCWIEASIARALRSLDRPERTMVTFHDPRDAIRTMKCIVCHCSAAEYRERSCSSIRDGKRVIHEHHTFQLIAGA